MTILKKLSLGLALLAFASPAWTQSPGTAQEPAKVRAKAKRAQGVKQVGPGQAPAKQGQKNAERAKNAREKQQGQAKNAKRTQEARDKQTAERVQAARDKQTAGRVQGARDKQQSEKGAQRAAGARAKLKALDTQALRSLGNQVKIHETNVARIDKLTEIFTRKGDKARLEQVRKLRTAEDTRYEAIIGRFKNALGAQRFASVRARLETSKRK